MMGGTPIGQEALLAAYIDRKLKRSKWLYWAAMLPLSSSRGCYFLPCLPRAFLIESQKLPLRT